MRMPTIWCLPLWVCGGDNALMDATYWRSEADDEAMQNEHESIWRAMLDTIDVDLPGRRVLDAGCNRGGFLRLLVDRYGIAEGFGYDPAAGAIEDAQRLAGGRPLHFEAASSVPAAWSGLDVAFSHEVLYLLSDLAPHAAAILRSLRPGGVYFAVMGVHVGSPLMVEWHAANREELRLPPLYSVDDVIATFCRAGFDASVARLAIRFVPVTGRGHGHDGRSLDWLAYYYDQKLLLRFTRQPGLIPAEASGAA
jgi:SAM-dependent methyltransferase